MESNDPESLTVRVLVEIRDEIRKTNARVDALGDRVDALGERLDLRIDKLGDRLTEVEVRTATSITNLVGAVNDVRDLLRDRLDLRDRVERCEHDIADLKQRLH
jgi:chromosome segregation ATPase